MTLKTYFDYLVIGAGSGGIASARRAASYGASVAVIEQGLQILFFNLTHSRESRRHLCQQGFVKLCSMIH